MPDYKKRISAMLTAGALLLTLTACGQNTDPEVSSGDEHALTLSQEAVALDGQTVAEGADGAVTVSHDIVYYEAGQGADYGEGTADEEHSAEEANAHTVVTIRQAGTYRVSGTLEQGQLAVDLGDSAEDNSEAAVTVILDGAEVTCTVAPAFMVYNVYECGDKDTSSPTVNTSGAGIRVILADGSENTFTGSHVARIYEPGTTDKLHKYDGAFYSKMSMEIAGETEGTGILNIVGDNEGLDSELHLTINGGNINIESQDDGINTNEDGVSVTTVNGGTVQINAGLGAEGDGIDSNGHLVINGGNVYTCANDRSPDGGLDADGEILLNGGYVVALGTRNDAASEDSAQPFMELSFASTLPAGSEIALTDPEGNTLLNFSSEKAAQSLTFTSPDLREGVDYTLTVDGVVQSYTGHQTGGFPGMPGGFDRNPGGFGEGMNLPEGLESWLEGAQDVPDEIRTWLEDLIAMQSGRPELPDDMTLPNGQEPPRGEGQPSEGGRPQGEIPAGGGEETTGEASEAFTLTGGVHSFSGVTDSALGSDKTAVSFTADLSVGEDGTVSLANIQSDPAVDSSHVQLTVTDVPSENYAASCLLSDREDAIQAILPADPGAYRLTIAVFGDEAYTGSSQFTFTIPE